MLKLSYGFQSTAPTRGPAPHTRSVHRLLNFIYITFYAATLTVDNKTLENKLVKGFCYLYARFNNI